MSQAVTQQGIVDLLNRIHQSLTAAASKQCISAFKTWFKEHFKSGEDWDAQLWVHTAPFHVWVKQVLEAVEARAGARRKPI
ncbi:uncharacterized protein JCM6883_002952 [Sporobolomyces salmoneus]|uniref:uncharacterized protein n=1 Tax=Sporobolomyces salmoneus TaxID=183962 RepID=UPI00317F398D